MRALQIALMILVVLLLFLSGYYFYELRKLSEKERQLKEQVISLTQDVTSLQEEVRRLVGYPPALLYSFEELPSRFSEFVDTLRKNFGVEVQEVSFPVLVKEEEAEEEVGTTATAPASELLPGPVLLSRGESSLHFNKTADIFYIREIFQFLEKFPDWFLVQKMEISGGKVNPEYSIVLKAVYPLKPRRGGE